MIRLTFSGVVLATREGRESLYTDDHRPLYIVGVGNEFAILEADRGDDASWGDVTSDPNVVFGELFQYFTVASIEDLIAIRDAISDAVAKIQASEAPKPEPVVAVSGRDGQHVVVSGDASMPPSVTVGSRWRDRGQRDWWVVLFGPDGVLMQTAGDAAQSVAWTDFHRLFKKVDQ